MHGNCTELIKEHIEMQSGKAVNTLLVSDQSYTYIIRRVSAI